MNCRSLLGFFELYQAERNTNKNITLVCCNFIQLRSSHSEPKCNCCCLSRSFRTCFVCRYFPLFLQVVFSLRRLWWKVKAIFFTVSFILAVCNLMVSYGKEGCHSHVPLHWWTPADWVNTCVSCCLALFDRATKADDKRDNVWRSIMVGLATWCVGT